MRPNTTRDAIRLQIRDIPLAAERVWRALQNLDSPR
jgi:hypothetical protein